MVKTLLDAWLWTREISEGKMVDEGWKEIPPRLRSSYRN
jgi:hypothetical protein